jgi:rubrerythrin
MERQVLLDKLSEFLMVEQGGLQIYRVAASRAIRPDLKARYQAFGRQTDRHREWLVRAITSLGGDPSYVSPTARIAQAKADALLATALLAGTLSPEEMEANDLQNVLLAETVDHGNWQVLQRLLRGTGNLDVRIALEDAVREVGAEEDTHLGWARERLGQLALEMIERGPSPSPARWMHALSGPVPAIDRIHPSPVDSGLLGPARQAAWRETQVARDTA